MGNIETKSSLLCVIISQNKSISFMNNEYFVFHLQFFFIDGKQDFIYPRYPLICLVLSVVRKILERNCVN